MDNKTFRERFWNKYEYKKTKWLIVYWSKTKKDPIIYKLTLWNSEASCPDYQTEEEFIKDHISCVYEFWDTIPKFKIWNTIVTNDYWWYYVGNIEAISDDTWTITYKITWMSSWVKESECRLLP